MSFNPRVKEERDALLDRWIGQHPDGRLVDLTEAKALCATIDDLEAHLDKVRSRNLVFADSQMKLRGELAEIRAAVCWPYPLDNPRTTVQIVKDQSHAYKTFLKDISSGMECLSGCDSHGHEDFCPVTNTAEAWRQLRVELAQLKEEPLVIERKLVDDIRQLRAGTALLSESYHAALGVSQRLKERIEDWVRRLDVHGFITPEHFADGVKVMEEMRKIAESD